MLGKVYAAACTIFCMYNISSNNANQIGKEANAKGFNKETETAKVMHRIGFINILMRYKLFMIFFLLSRSRYVFIYVHVHTFYFSLFFCCVNRFNHIRFISKLDKCYESGRFFGMFQILCLPQSSI